MDSLPCQRSWTGLVVALLVSRAVVNLLGIHGQQPGPVGSPLHAHNKTVASHDTDGMQIEALLVLAMQHACRKKRKITPLGVITSAS